MAIFVVLRTLNGKNGAFSTLVRRGSKSISRVLYPFGRLSLISESTNSFVHRTFVLRTSHCCVSLSLPTLRLTRAALKRRFTWNCSPQCARFTLLVSVAGTKHYCLTVVNRCGALCCPDFPLRMRSRSVPLSFSPQR